MPSQPQRPPPLVACVNSSEDVVQMLADYLREDGFRAVSYVTPVRFGAEAVIQFVTNLKPDACIYTVSLPYEESWHEFERLRAAAPAVPFILTTTNERALRELVGPTDSIEVIGKPFDLDRVCDAVRAAIAAGPGRPD
jgi:DNA-binding response OmpR family regulator